MSGAKSKLTDELQSRVCELLRGGLSYRSTCALVRVSQHAFFEWLKRGKSEPGTKFGEFYQRVTEARAQWEGICMRTVRSAVVGGWYDSPVYDKDGNPVPQIDPETGEVLRDERGRPKMHMKSEFREPDARLAWQVAQRMNVAEFGDPEKDAPDPQGELDRAPTTQVAVGESDHKKISTSTLAKAVAFLAEQGVDIPGMIPDPNAKKGDVEDAVVVSETKFIGGPDVSKP